MVWHAPVRWMLVLVLVLYFVAASFSSDCIHTVGGTCVPTVGVFLRSVLSRDCIGDAVARILKTIGGARRESPLDCTILVVLSAETFISCLLTQVFGQDCVKKSVFCDLGAGIFEQAG